MTALPELNMIDVFNGSLLSNKITSIILIFDEENILIPVVDSKPVKREIIVTKSGNCLGFYLCINQEWIVFRGIDCHVFKGESIFLHDTLLTVK